MAAQVRLNCDSTVKTSTPVRKGHASANAAGIDFGVSPISKNQAALPPLSLGNNMVNDTSLRHSGIHQSFSSILNNAAGQSFADDAARRSVLDKVQRLNRLLSVDASVPDRLLDGVSRARDAKDGLASSNLRFTNPSFSADRIGSTLNYCTADSEDEEDSDGNNNADSTVPEFDVKKLFSFVNNSTAGASDGANTDFVDADTFHRSRMGRGGALIYASKRSRLSARAVKVLQSLSEQLDRQRNDNRTAVTSLKAAAGALSKSAQTDNAYAQKLHQHMNVFNEELYNQQSLSSEWQVVRKRCETSVTALNELERILSQLTTFRANFIDQVGGVAGGSGEPQQQMYLDDERMRSLVAALNETLESRNYIQSLMEGATATTSQPIAIVANVDEMLALATSTVLRYLRSALSDSEIKPVLLLDAVENDLKSEVGLANQTAVGGVAQDDVAMRQELLAKSRPVELIDYSQSTYRMLKQASSWLHKAYSYAFGRSFDHISLYYQIRSQVMTRSLQDFIRYVRDERSRQFFFAHAGVSNGSGRSASTVTANSQAVMQRGGRGGAMLSAPSEASLLSAGTTAAGAYRSATILRNKFRGSERSSGYSTASTTVVPGGQLPNYNNKSIMPYDEAVHELDAFLLSAKAYLKLVQVELLLCNDLIEAQDRSGVFERIISQPMVGLLVEHARRVVKQVSALHDGVDSQSLLLVLQALHHIDSLTNSYQQLLAGVSSITYTKWIDIVSMFEASGLTSIDLFVDKLRKTDSTTSAAPSDGAVHELTIRTVNLLNGLNQWKDECSRLLTNRAGPAVAMLPTTNSPPHTSGGSQKTATIPVFSNFLATMLASVNSTVITRSHLYNDPFLAAIFRLNNHHYILRTLRNGTLVREIERAEPKIERIFEEQIVQAEDDYKRCWSPLMLAMHDLLSHPVTNKPLRTSYDEHKVEISAKDKEMMKQRCTTIKKELDELYKRQVKYKISDQTLRDVMIDNIMSMVLTQYKVFYENYKLVDFTSNRQKYMPYTPQHVETMIKQFFSGESYEFANG